MHKASTICAVAAAVICLSGIAAALTPADKCEVNKLKRAGKYNFCRLKADSKAIKKGSAPDYSLCDSMFGEKWSHAESVGAGQCPSNGDLAAMQARVTADTGAVAGCLNGACPPSCGDGTANGAESCDGADLAGATCGSLGFARGTLACTAGCGFEVSGCQPYALPATGQTTDYGPGSDGAVQAGAPMAYTDNGDGTITDHNTGLMWEKKSADGSVHDTTSLIPWGMTTPPYAMAGLAVFLDTLNDVSGGGTSCFAGHCDWRVPNSRELYSIVDLGSINPAVAPPFRTVCFPGCTVLTCSCTQSGFYWSSSSSQELPYNAWGVEFFTGIVSPEFRMNLGHVRAVRGPDAQ